MKEKVRALEEHTETLLKLMAVQQLSIENLGRRLERLEELIALLENALAAESTGN